MAVRVTLVALAVLAAQMWPSAVQAFAQSAPQSPDLGSISGRVLGTSDNPLAGATVSLTTLSGFWRDEPPKVATTNERGQFRFEGLRPARYLARFELPCHTREAEEMSLAAGEALTKDVVLIHPAFITGRVITPLLEPAAAVRVTAVRATGTPLPLEGSSVLAAALSMSLSPCPGRTQTAGPSMTGSDGVYSIHVPPGLFYIQTSSSGTGELMATYFPGARNQADATAVQVREGEIVRNIDIRLEVATPSVAIQMIGADAGSIRNLRLSYGREDQLHRGSRTGQSAVPDDRGRLFVYDPRMPAGPMTVFAFAEGANGPLVAFGTANLNDNYPTELELTLGGFGIVHGRVTRVNGDDKIPPDLSVSLVPTGYVPREHENTAFAAPAHSPFVAEGLAGYYQVNIHPNGWRIRSVTDRGRTVDSRQLEVRPDDAVDLQIEVEAR